MQRSPYGISSIGSLIIMVVLLSGVIGVSIPLMSGGLPRRQGDAQNSATPAHSEMVASQAGTPAVLAEAASMSDGSVGLSSKSTPVVSTPVHSAASTPTATSTVLPQRPKALVRSADSFASVDTQQAATPSRTPSVVQPTPTASSTTAVVQALNSSFHKHVITRGNRHFSTCGTCYVTCPTHTSPAASRPPYPSPQPRRLRLRRWPHRSYSAQLLMQDLLGSRSSSGGHPFHWKTGRRMRSWFGRRRRIPARHGGLRRPLRVRRWKSIWISCLQAANSARAASIGRCW